MKYDITSYVITMPEILESMPEFLESANRDHLMC